MKKAFLALAAGFMVLAAGTQKATAGCGTCDKTIVENAVASKDFATLVAAVKAAGLVDTLAGDDCSLFSHPPRLPSRNFQRHRC